MHRLKRVKALLEEALRVVDAMEGHSDPDWRKCIKGGMSIAEVEKRLIVNTLELCGWSLPKSSRMLGISYNSLKWRMQRHKICRLTVVDSSRDNVAPDRHCYDKVEHG